MKERRGQYLRAAYRLLLVASGLDDLRTQISLSRLAATYLERACSVGAQQPFRA